MPDPSRFYWSAGGMSLHPEGRYILHRDHEVTGCLLTIATDALAEIHRTGAYTSIEDLRKIASDALLKLRP